MFGRGTGDSAPHVPRGLVVAAEPGSGPGPRHARADSVVYEVHVRGFTMRHPGVPEELRGTYAGLAHPAALAHLTDLGVTAVELLPVHHNVPEPFLRRRGLTNHWVYNTIGFLAPHAGYSAAVRAERLGGQVQEFRDMVTTLHAAGLDVLLDVVFNHTAEAGANGPVLSLRGLHTTAATTTSASLSNNCSARSRLWLMSARPAARRPGNTRRGSRPRWQPSPPRCSRAPRP